MYDDDALNVKRSHVAPARRSLSLASAPNASAPNASAPNASAPNASAPNASAPNATAATPAHSSTLAAKPLKRPVSKRRIPIVDFSTIQLNEPRLDLLAGDVILYCHANQYLIEATVTLVGYTHARLSFAQTNCPGIKYPWSYKAVPTAIQTQLYKQFSTATDFTRVAIDDKHIELYVALKDLSTQCRGLFRPASESSKDRWSFSSHAHRPIQSIRVGDVCDYIPQGSDIWDKTTAPVRPLTAATSPTNVAVDAVCPYPHLLVRIMHERVDHVQIRLESTADQKKPIDEWVHRRSLRLWRIVRSTLGVPRLPSTMHDWKTIDMYTPTPPVTGGISKTSSGRVDTPPTDVLRPLTPLHRRLPTPYRHDTPHEPASSPLSTEQVVQTAIRSTTVL